MKKIIQGIFNSFGLKIVGYPDRVQKRYSQLLNNQNIDTVLDVGANTGQFAISLRKLGYSKKIVSFEPVKAPYEELCRHSKLDTSWVAEPYALGEQNGKTMINISGNSYSSSILDMLPEHIESAPSSEYVAQEEIEIKRLDNVFQKICAEDANVLLKIDTQGFEKSVLEGAEGILDKIKMVELEMSLVPLYEDGILYDEIIKFMETKGFQLYSLEHVFSNPKTGQLLQVDGIFVRKDKEG